MKKKDQIKELEYQLQQADKSLSKMLTDIMREQDLRRSAEAEVNRLYKDRVQPAEARISHLSEELLLAIRTYNGALDAQEVAEKNWFAERERANSLESRLQDAEPACGELQADNEALRDRMLAAENKLQLAWLAANARKPFAGIVKLVREAIK